MAEMWRYAKCPRCGQSIQVEVGTGYATQHYRGRTECTPEMVPLKRRRPRRKSSSIRTVSGGLPTLGRDR